MKKGSSNRNHKVKLLTLYAKNHNKSAILNFFQPLWNLFENWSFVTCIPNLLLLSPKVNVNADANANAKL